MKEFFRVNANKYVPGKNFDVVRPASLNNPKDNAVMFIGEKYMDQADALLKCENCLVFWPESVEVPKKVSKRHAVCVVKNERYGYCAFFRDNGITYYHCDVAEIVEVIEITKGRHYPHVTVRAYRIHYSDGDYSTGIEKYQLSDYKVGRKITKKEFAELKEIILNPDTFEKSKWYVKE